MQFLLRTIAWVALNLVLTAIGVIVGASLTPPVNVHNDRSVTGLTFAVCGGFVGNSTTIVLLLWTTGRHRSDA